MAMYGCISCDAFEKYSSNALSPNASLLSRPLTMPIVNLTTASVLSTMVCLQIIWPLLVDQTRFSVTVTKCEQ